MLNEDAAIWAHGDPNSVSDAKDRYSVRTWFDLRGRTRVHVFVLAVLISFVMSALAYRGSWFSDDFEFLIHGRRGFSLDALFSPVNDHILPGFRLAWAALATLDGPNWLLAVGVRAALWLAAILLMAGLVWRLTESRAAVLGATVLYGLSPVSMPSFMYLAAALNTLPAHVLGLTVVHCTLDWFERRTWPSAAGAAAALLISVTFWEKSVLIVPTALAVVLIAVPRERRTVRDLALYVTALVTPGTVYGVAYLLLGRQSEGSAPAISDWPLLLGSAVVNVVATPLIGGPGRWRPVDPPFAGQFDPHPFVAVLALAVLALILVLAVRRARSVLWLWGSVLVFCIVTVGLVSIGRFELFGLGVARQPHYWTDIAIPLTLAVVLTLHRSHWLPRATVLKVALPAIWVIAMAWSFMTFADLWGRNPSGDYLEAMVSDVAAEPTGLNLWDTRPPLDVMPYTAQNRRVSSLLNLTGAKAGFLLSTPEPLVIDDGGHLRQAEFSEWTSARIKPDCGTLLKGNGSITLDLNRALPEGEWAIMVAYLANPSATVEMSLVTRLGHSEPLLSTDNWDAGLASAYAIADKPTTGTAIRLTSTEPGANICIDSARVGLVRPQP